MKRLLLPAVAVITLSPVLAACGSTESDEGLDVVASFYPVAFVSERVGGDAANVEVLSKPGVDAHDLELAPKQVAAVQDADVVVYQKDFQAAMDDAIQQADRSPSTLVDSTKGVDLIEESAEDGHDHGDEEGHDHGDEEHSHEEEGHEEEGHEGHDHGPGDPHIWLDPANMISLARDVERAFGEADPDNAETYTANADELIAELRELESDFAAGLEQCERREFVVSHAAFGYLARAFDLEQEPIAGIDPSNEPSAAQLAELSDLVRDEGITTVFTERLVSSAVADTVAREAGAQTAVLDPLEGLTDETEDEDYISLMRQNLEALRTANDCS